MRKTGKKYDLAIKEFRIALSLNKHQAEADLGLGNVYYNLGDLTNAKGNCTKAINKNPYYAAQKKCFGILIICH